MIIILINNNFAFGTGIAVSLLATQRFLRVSFPKKEPPALLDLWAWDIVSKDDDAARNNRGRVVPCEANNNIEIQRKKR